MLSHEMTQAFAHTRNKGLNFSFLKENGELLSIIRSSGMGLEPRSLELYSEFYENVLTLCDLYPPFFRFFLAIVLDLEALGMPGDKGDILSDYVIKRDLYEHETSDTRRWEIINLLARTGRSPNYKYDSRQALEDRARGFFHNPDRFIKFNRPLFYDLTHIVFFWTNYGELEMEAYPELLKSLTNIGLLAFLDNDFDLLAEVCLCFEFVGEKAPQSWYSACEKGRSIIQIEQHDIADFPNGPPTDEYHIYFVLNWLFQFTGKPAFTETMTSQMPVFQKVGMPNSALGALSHRLHSSILAQKEGQFFIPLNSRDILSRPQHSQLAMAAVATPQFDEFFDKFSGGKIVLS